MYPCEKFARNILPVFRWLVAKELIEKYDLTQLEAAEKLGTTQAAISYYVHSKRGGRGKTQFEEMLPTIQVAAFEAANGLATGKISSNEVVQDFCKLCTLLRREKKTFRTTALEESSPHVFLASGI